MYSRTGFNSYREMSRILRYLVFPKYIRNEKDNKQNLTNISPKYSTYFLIWIVIEIYGPSFT